MTVYGRSCLVTTVYDWLSSVVIDHDWLRLVTGHDRGHDDVAVTGHDLGHDRVTMTVHDWSCPGMINREKSGRLTTR